MTTRGQQTRPGNPGNLRRAAAAKSAAATRRAEEGLRRMVKNGEPITFEAVAAAAGVSKDFLYRSTELRPRIEQLRTQQTTESRSRRVSTAPPAESVSSTVRTLTLKLAQERERHRREVADLKAALAAAHGELLTLKRRHGVSR